MSFMLIQLNHSVDFSRKKSGQLVALSCMFQVGFGLIFTINAKNLDSGYSRFQTAKLVNA